MWRWASTLRAIAIGADQTARANSPNTVVEAETRVDAVPQKIRRWRVRSGAPWATNQRHGNLRVSLEENRRGGPLVFAFATGVDRDRPALQRRAGGFAAVSAGASFAAVAGGDPRVELISLSRCSAKT